MVCFNIFYEILKTTLLRAEMTEEYQTLVPSLYSNVGVFVCFVVLVQISEFVLEPLLCDLHFYFE